MKYCKGKTINKTNCFNPVSKNDYCWHHIDQEKKPPEENKKNLSINEEEWLRKKYKITKSFLRMTEKVCIISAK
jgi:hypothetical protein